MLCYSYSKGKLCSLFKGSRSLMIVNSTLKYGVAVIDQWRKEVTLGAPAETF